MPGWFISLSSARRAISLWIRDLAIEVGEEI
jgi:hypothetical protein